MFPGPFETSAKAQPYGPIPDPGNGWRQWLAAMAGGNGWRQWRAPGLTTM